MRVLIVDRTAEGQAICARRVESFHQSDVEMLDLRVKLVLEKEFEVNFPEADVLILGSGLGENGPSLARKAQARMPWLHIIMFVTEEAYSAGAFRSAYSVGVRKVLPNSASPLDLLQELVAIHAEFRRDGRVREGKVICVTHAKGGTGATSITAAIAEVCSVYQKRAMLWDLDVETRDLCRSLTVSGSGAKVVSSWINGAREVTRDSILDALVPVSQDVSVLMPPDGMAEAMELVCHTDARPIVKRVLDLARVMHDVVLIDTGGRIGPATGELMKASDEVVIVIDDTVLGLTALDLYLSYIKAILSGTDRVSFIVNGYDRKLLSVSQIEEELEPVHHLGRRPWRLPPVPPDTKAHLWPGSGRTLYSMGEKNTRASLEEIAAGLGIISRELGSVEEDRTSAWWERLLPKGENPKEAAG